MYVCVHVYTNTFILMNENYSFCIILILCVFSELAIRNWTKNMCTLSWGRPINFCFALKFPQFPIVFFLCRAEFLWIFPGPLWHIYSCCPCVAHSLMLFMILLWDTLSQQLPWPSWCYNLATSSFSMFSELYVQKCFIDKLTSTVQHNSAV